MWQFRVRVPQDVRSKIGKSEVSKSLGTSSYHVAIGQARKVAYQIECMFDQARSGLPVQVDLAQHGESQSEPAQPIIVDVEKVARIIAEKVVEATPQPEPSAPPIADRTIKQVYEGYMADPSRQFSGKTKIAYDSIYKMLIEVIGENTHIRQLTRERCRGVLNLLRQLPANAAKKYPKLTLKQAAERGSRDGAPRISVGTVNGYIQKLSALLSWSVNEGYLDKNPARGLKVADTVKRKDKRQPFAPWQLQKIFDAPLYRGCRNDGAGYATPGNDKPRRGRFWVPLIALFSGMRLNEICQLNVEDVRVVDGIHCFIVTTDVENGVADKKLKTSSGERLIPVHPELIRIGFLQHVTERRLSRSAKLFPELTVAKSGYYSDTFSKFFANFLNKAGAKATRTSFHSFRHNFRDALREARVDREIALALGGWAGDSGDNETADNYGRGFNAPTLFQAVSLIQFEGLDLSFLCSDLTDCAFQS